MFPARCIISATRTRKCWILTTDQPGGGTVPRPATVISRDAAWPNPQAGSQWISSYPGTVQKATNEFDFQTYFCLESNAANVELSICIRADDNAQAFLNGIAIPIGNTAFSSSSPGCSGPVTSGFIFGGQNVLKVVVNNTTGGAMGLNVTGTLSGSGMTVGKPDCCQPFSGLSGRYFFDEKGTGTEAPGEPAISGIPINLYGNGSTTNFITSTTTDANGYYYFENLLAGTYTVSPAPTSGLLQTAPASGSYTVTLGVAQQVSAQDFGAVSVNTNSGCVQISGPSNIIAQCNGAGANVDFDVTATSSCDSNLVTVTTTPYSGYFFPVGTTTVYCSAVDEFYNYTNYSFTVTVDCNAGVVFTNTPPATAIYACLGDVPPPPDVTATTECAGGATVAYSEAQSNPLSPVCSNVLTRTWTATDECGNTNAFTQTVTVVNTNAPVITGLSNIVITSSTNIAINYTPAATGLCCGSVPVVCVPGFR